MERLRINPGSILIIVILLVYTQAIGETRDSEDIFLPGTILTSYRYFQFITIKDLNLTLDRYHQIDKSKMAQSQQDSIQIGMFNVGDLLYDIAVLYRARGEIVIYENNGNGTLSPYRILRGKNKKGIEAKAIRLLPPEDIIANPSRRCGLEIDYGDGSERIVSDIEILKGRSDIIENGTTDETEPDMMTLPRGSLTDITFIEQWRSQNNGVSPRNVVVGDIDKDGKNEVVYTFWPLDQSAFPTRIVVFECVNQNTYRVDWDTTLQHGGYCLNSSLLDFDNDGNLEFFGIGWGSMTQNWEIGLWECTGEGKYRFKRIEVIYSMPQTIDVKDTVTLNGITSKGFFLCYSSWVEPYYTAICKYRYSAKYLNSYVFNSTLNAPSVPCFVYSMQAGKFDEDGRYMFAIGIAQWSSYYISYLDSTGVSTNAGYEWKDMDFNEPVSGGFLLGKDLEGDGTPEIFAAGIGVGTGSVGVVKHSGSPGENQWRTMWWDTVGVRGTPVNSMDSGIYRNKYSILHNVSGATGGPYHTRDVLHLSIYSKVSDYDFSRVVYVMKDSSSFSSARFCDMDKDGKMNVVSPGYYGIWGNDTNFLLDYEETGSIGIQPIGNIIPERYNLLQNYPNPFNSETVIKFDIPKNENITLRIYDMTGREIATLINEYKVAGSYKINFNADRYKMSSGIYFYILKSDSFTETKKFVYIK